jgi:catechol 2,3-dioxygenase-like lactoylglutathione lyase family enzyme
MLGHVGINVPDLQAARAYYDALMPWLDYETFFMAEDEFSYRPAGGKRGTFVFFYPASEPGAYTRHATGLQHLAFIVPTRAAVRAVLDVARGLGSQVVHDAQDWPAYPPPYFAAFWTDPFGIMLETVCHHDR